MLDKNQYNNDCVKNEMMIILSIAITAVVVVALVSTPCKNGSCACLVIMSNNEHVKTNDFSC